MVERASGTGPHWPARRSSWPPNGEVRDPQRLEQWIEQSLQRADQMLAQGNRNEAAVSFSTAARKCMERAGLGSREAAIDWIEKSIGPRRRAIELFHEVGRTLDEARDRSFLGKAYSRLGVIKRNMRLLASALLERTLALELFRQLRLVKQQAEELSYLADDLRALGWLESEPQLRSYLYLKSVGYSEAALLLYPRYLTGEELEARRLHENGFISQAKGYAALCGSDRGEVHSAKDLCHSLADRLEKHGADYQSRRLLELAKDLDKYWFSLKFKASP